LDRYVHERCDMNCVLFSIQDPDSLQATPQPHSPRPNIAYTYPISRPVVPAAAITGIADEEKGGELGFGLAHDARDGGGEYAFTAIKWA
jgi:hypothetical protein